MPTGIEPLKISKKIKWTLLPCNPSGNCVCPPGKKQTIFDYRVSISTGEYLFCYCKLVLFMTCTGSTFIPNLDVIFTLKISHSLGRLKRWTVSISSLIFFLKILICLHTVYGTASDKNPDLESETYSQELWTEAFQCTKLHVKFKLNPIHLFLSYKVPGSRWEAGSGQCHNSVNKCFK